MRHSTRALHALVLAVTTAAATARADEPAPDGHLPMRFVERPLTLPPMLLRGDASLRYLKVGSADTSGGALGAGFGVTKDLELDATLVPLGFSPNFQYGNPSASGTYRFLAKPELEIGAGLGATIITHDTAINGSVAVTPSIPVLVRPTKDFRIDTGAALTFTFGGPSTQVGLFAPGSFSYQLLDPLYVGVGTGFGAGRLGDFSSTVYIPAGVYGGYTFARNGAPFVDVRPSFFFPALFTPGSPGDKVNTDILEFALIANVFVDTTGGGAVAPPPTTQEKPKDPPTTPKDPGDVPKPPDIYGHDDPPPCCGPDVTDKLVGTLQTVIEDYKKLAWYEKAAQWAGFGFWDVEPLRDRLKQILPPGCPKGGPCDATVMIFDRCFEAGVVNYTIYGVIEYLIGGRTTGTVAHGLYWLGKEVTLKTSARLFAAENFLVSVGWEYAQSGYAAAQAQAQKVKGSPCAKCPYPPKPFHWNYTWAPIFLNQPSRH